MEGFNIKINLICVGKLKEDYLREAAANYVKLLSRFADVSVIETAEAPLTGNIGKADINQALNKEAKAIAEKLSGYVVVCDIDGETMSSHEFASRVSGAMSRGASEISFVVGSSYGIAEDIKNRADLRLSFGKMTMPHRLFRVVLAEQAYRAFTIIAGGSYNK